MTTSALRPAVPLLVLIIAGCIIAAVGNGIRSSFGLFTLPMTGDLGLTREGWGMAMAIQNLAWGIAQPFAGAWADRVGTGRTIAVGLAVYAIGVLAMAFSPPIAPQERLAYGTVRSLDSAQVLSYLRATASGP